MSHKIYTQAQFVTGGQLDGTSGKGRFDEIYKVLSGGFYLRGIDLDLGVAGGKSYAIYRRRRDGSKTLLFAGSGLGAPVQYVMFNDMTIPFAEDEAITVETTAAVNPRVDIYFTEKA